MEDLLTLRNRAAVVVGAASAIGSATAQIPAEAGARVAVVDRDPVSTPDLAATLAAAAGETLPFPGDPDDPRLPARVVAEVIGRFGGLHILLMMEAAPAAAQAWVHAAEEPLRHPGPARILCLVPMAARYGLPGAADQAASGGSLIALCRTWDRELGPHRVTSNAVVPGLIGDDPACPIPPAVLPRIHAGRAGRAREVASVFLYLASDLAGFVNGAVVGVDGGLLL
ncbi:MAG TPA: SDR family oxidoreductase [Vicinamibacteria bacterium]|nr:SDR family oxidoreductase [Vicinamibacteria bacterium]